ncbi:MAG: YiiD C-terminal domain-containing protein [Legionella sp.]|uniref:YiiD C-terminal domain-containing protein n=1 Tax=Legionella sp. TaxID=459 RepID=UPI0039E4341C
MKFSNLLKLMRIWPPFLGAGISVKSFSPDYTHLVVQMKLHFWNQNYVGTQYGGSIYSMTDPFYMLMLMNLLGKEYIIWDKSASIHYKKPAKGTIYATFTLSAEQITRIRQQIEQEDKVEPEFIVPITDDQGKLIAEVKKILYVAKKTSS